LFFPLCVSLVLFHPLIFFCFVFFHRNVMRVLTKLATVSAITVCSGAAGVLYYQRARASSSEAAGSKPKELSAKEFNALQDTQFLKDALSAHHLPWTYHNAKNRYSDRKEALAQPTPATYTPSSSDVKIIFYRLLGCPYCAKVESVLQFGDVPYEEVWIDPITGEGLPDRRYQLAPQLHFTPLARPAPPPTAADTTSEANKTSNMPGAFIVDSAAIVAALAEPLRFTADLANPHTSETRDWITNHFHGASFAITNSTFRNSYDTYTYVTPSKYQNVFYHLVGSAALSVLSRLKIQPRLIAKMETPMSTDAPPKADVSNLGESTGLWMLPDESRMALAATIRKGTPEDWLRAELGIFLGRRPSGAIFHGGAKPDLADVEMYGVSRVVDQHPRLGNVVREGAFGEWQTAMQARLKEMTGAVYA
jgi:microsomal prostaglandin-E synthase 2